MKFKTGMASDFTFFGGEGFVSLRGIVDPDELAVLSQTLEEYCAENGIGIDHPDREPHYGSFFERGYHRR